jgi:2-keto-4-pentenoate hydratase/2-oxohepta-3-ene-1,7-dioic acid hydratase in catechol pathway
VKLIDYIAAGEELHAKVRAAATAGSWAAGTTTPLADVRLHAPLRPGKVVGVGLNYVEHVEESSRTLDTDKELPTRPVLFSKPGTAVVGPNEPIQHNGAMTQQLDWECELAVVMGAAARNVSEADALKHVFGYSIVNDISARDQRRSGQWFFSKGQDSYCPFGPMIVTTDEITDPHTLQLSLTVNGDQRQNGNSKHMLFKIPTLIADISSGVTLEPGDVIATGTPAGIWTMESRLSMPLRALDSTGTPNTGTTVLAANIPGKCAAPPAPAIMAINPRSRAVSAYVNISSGILWAETT